MKKNHIVLILLFITYIAVSVLYYCNGFAAGKTAPVRYEPENGKAAELSIISRTLAGVSSPGDVTAFRIGTDESGTNIFRSGYRDEIKCKLLFTNNKDYKKIAEINKISGIENIKPVTDYKTSLPVFEDKAYEKTAAHYIDPGFDTDNDLLVIKAVNGKAQSYFYIDGRLADFKDVMNTAASSDLNPESYNFYGGRAEIQLMFTPLRQNKFTAIKDSYTKDYEDEEIVSSKEYTDEDGNHVTETVYADPDEPGAVHTSGTVEIK